MKWLIYTIAVGLIPIGARLLVYTLSTHAPEAFMWSVADIASFGLVLNISNINALEHEHTDPYWKTIANGVSILFLVFIGMVFTAAYVSEIQQGLLEPERLKFAAAVMSGASVLLSYIVYHRLSQLSASAPGEL